MISAQNEIQKTADVIESILSNYGLLGKIERAAEICQQALLNGNKVLFCGNGGSAADSQHLAAELVSRLNFDRPGIPAIALTTDTSILTAIGNDYGFENIFSRQVESIGQEGDILFAISTSGNSKNILQAIKTAKNMKITVIGKSGKDGGKMAKECDLIIKIPSISTQKIQECHIMIGHVICGIIEESLFSK